MFNLEKRLIKAGKQNFKMKHINVIKELKLNMLFCSIIVDFNEQLINQYIRSALKVKNDEMLKLPIEDKIELVMSIRQSLIDDVKEFTESDFFKKLFNNAIDKNRTALKYIHKDDKLNDIDKSIDGIINSNNEFYYTTIYRIISDFSIPTSLLKKITMKELIFCYSEKMREQSFEKIFVTNIAQAIVHDLAVIIAGKSKNHSPSAIREIQKRLYKTAGFESNEHEICSVRERLMRSDKVEEQLKQTGQLPINSLADIIELNTDNEKHS